MAHVAKDDLMTFSVLVEPHEGWFSASLAGAPQVQGVAATRDEAVAALKHQIVERIAHGELVPLEVTDTGITGLAGAFADDPCLREICEEAYRDRDAEKQG